MHDTADRSPAYDSAQCVQQNCCVLCIATAAAYVLQMLLHRPGAVVSMIAMQAVSATMVDTDVPDSTRGVE